MDLNAYLLSGLVVWTGGVSEEAPPGLAYDTIMEKVNPSVGQFWNGSAFVAPPPGSVQANLAALRVQAAVVLSANLQDIADADAWLNGVGAGTGTLTAAQLSPAVRQIMRALRASKKAENGAIRMMLGRYEGTN